MAEAFPSADLAVIVAVPTEFAVIFPEETLATPVSLDVQVTVWDAVEGDTLALNVVVDPIVRLAEVFDKVTPVAGASEIVTLQVVVFPFDVLAVMVAEPAFMPVTLPADTVAMDVSLDVHVTV